MSNPAKELRSIFRKWSVSNQNAHIARGFTKDEEGATREHIRAMRLISDIHVILDQWERDERDVAVYRAAAGTWARAVLAHPGGFNGTNSAIQSVRIAKLDVLEALSDTLSITGPRVNIERVAEFEDYLSGVLKLLGEDDSLTKELRGYILNLVQEIRLAFESFKITGQFDHADALVRLWVALKAARGESKSSKKRWKSFADKIAQPAAIQLVAGLPMATVNSVLALTVGG